MNQIPLGSKDPNDSKLPTDQELSNFKQENFKKIEGKKFLVEGLTWEELDDVCMTTQAVVMVQELKEKIEQITKFMTEKKDAASRDAISMSIMPHLSLERHMDSLVETVKRCAESKMTRSDVFIRHRIYECWDFTIMFLDEESIQQHRTP